jgi:biopolymer transport protein ExbD
MKNRKFSFNKRNKNKELDVDITSLLDILVILLVFLLKSYNASDLKLELAKGITLPQSQSRNLGHHAVVVQVSKDKDIILNDKKIGKYTNEVKINSLFNALSEIKKENLEIAKNEKKKKNIKVNIVLDQSLPYGVMKSIMHTSASAGFPEFKFIVTGNYQ